MHKVYIGFELLPFLTVVLWTTDRQNPCFFLNVKKKRLNWTEKKRKRFFFSSFVSPFEVFTSSEPRVARWSILPRSDGFVRLIYLGQIILNADESMLYTSPVGCEWPVIQSTSPHNHFEFAVERSPWRCSMQSRGTHTSGEYLNITRNSIPIAKQVARKPR